MPPSLILDTNILVAGLRSSRGASHALLRSVGTGLFDIGLTAALVFEYEAILKRPGKVPTSPEDVDVLLDYLCRIGKRSAVRFKVRPSALDPSDDFVIEAAIAADCKWIVTHNVRDLMDGARQYGIEVMTPAEALSRLRGSS